VDVKNKRARLVQVHHESTGKEQRYNLAVLIDTVANYPKLMDSTHYVRSVRHQLEKQGLQSVHEEFPIKIGGREFSGAVLLSRDPRFHRGIYATFDRGIILSFDVETSEEEGLGRILANNVRFRQVSPKQ
jgi:hypothetical protein